MGIFNYTIPVLMAAVFVVALIKKVNIFEEFVAGVGDGFKVVLKIAPVLIALLTAIAMVPRFGRNGFAQCGHASCRRAFGHPGRADDACRHAPALRLRLDRTAQRLSHPVRAGFRNRRMASVLAASTETTFYTLTVYMGSVGIKKTGRALPRRRLCPTCAAIFGAVITVRLFL